MSILAPTPQRLTPETASVRLARRAVARAVEQVLDPGHREGVVLATSELVTNAVEHGAPPIELKVEECDGRVRVEVQDGSPVLPHWRDDEPDPTDVRGRGMLIVQRCSDRAGVEELDRGKAVWFEIDLTDGPGS